MILDLDRLHEPHYAARGQGVTTRVLVGVLQRFDFDRSAITVVAHDQRRAVRLRYDAALVAEALGFWTTPSAGTLVDGSRTRIPRGSPAAPFRVETMTLYVHEAGRLAERMIVRFAGWNCWAEGRRGSSELVAFDPPGLGVMWQEAGNIAQSMIAQATENRQLLEVALGLNPWRRFR